MPYPPQLAHLRTLTHELRQVALFIIAGEGHFTVCLDNDFFSTEPLKAMVYWHNALDVTESTQLCLMRLTEITTIEGEDR